MVARTAMIQNNLTSPLSGVSDLAWARFVDALTIDDDDGLHNGAPRAFNARTHAGGFGCFGILPRRLVDIGVAKAVRVIDGKAIAVDFVRRDFLANPLAQRDALTESMKRYDAAIGELPAEMSRSGALALYHRLGPEALSKWAQHKAGSTIALFQRANGIF